MILVSVFVALCASAPATADYIKEYIAGNWSIEMKQAQPQRFNNSNYYARVRKTPEDTFIVSFHQDNESTAVINECTLIFNVTYYSIQFQGEEAHVYDIARATRYHLASTGKYQKFLFNYILCSSSRYHLNLIDQESNEMIRIDIIKDIVRREKTFLWKNRYTLIGVGVIVIFNILELYRNYRKSENAYQDIQKNKQKIAQSKKNDSAGQKPKADEKKPEKAEQNVSESNKKAKEKGD